MKIFHVNYSDDDQLLNLPNNVEDRIKSLEELLSRGYTHVEDEYMTMYTGKQYTPISVYITETQSYI